MTTNDDNDAGAFGESMRDAVRNGDAVYRLDEAHAQAVNIVDGDGAAPAVWLGMETSSGAVNFVVPVEGAHLLAALLDDVIGDLGQEGTSTARIEADRPICANRDVAALEARLIDIDEAGISDVGALIEVTDTAGRRDELRVSGQVLAELAPVVQELARRRDSILMERERD